MRLVILFAILMLVSSCEIYEVFTTTSDVLPKDNYNRFYFENDDVKLIYNFWSKGGRFYYTIYNKTDHPIFVDWAKSNFVKNDIAMDYWKDVEYSTSKTESKTIGSAIILTDNKTVIGGSKTTEVTNTKKEKSRPDVQIPPKSAIEVNTFDISHYLTYKKNTILAGRAKHLSYDKTDTPIRFRNYLAYSFDKNLDSLKYIDHDFWTTSIDVMADRDFKKLYIKNAEARQPYMFYDYIRDQRKTRGVKAGIIAGVPIAVVTALVIVLTNTK